jgi:hypothetical protein
VPPRQASCRLRRRPSSSRTDGRLPRRKCALAAIGVHAPRELITVPLLMTTATRQQIAAIARLNDVETVYLHSERWVLVQGRRRQSGRQGWRGRARYLRGRGDRREPAAARQHRGRTRVGRRDAHACGLRLIRGLAVPLPGEGAREGRATRQGRARLEQPHDRHQRCKDGEADGDLESRARFRHLHLWGQGPVCAVAFSTSLDNSYEIAEFDAEAGKSYTISIARKPTTANEDVWYGIAWMVHPRA